MSKSCPSTSGKVELVWEKLSQLIAGWADLPISGELTLELELASLCDVSEHINFIPSWSIELGFHMAV
jgi:hypothetical protein